MHILRRTNLQTKRKRETRTEDGDAAKRKRVVSLSVGEWGERRVAGARKRLAEAARSTAHTNTNLLWPSEDEEK